jgi:hypothetical protein
MGNTLILFLIKRIVIYSQLNVLRTVVWFGCFICGLGFLRFYLFLGEEGIHAVMHRRIIEESGVGPFAPSSFVWVLGFLARSSGLCW